MKKIDLFKNVVKKYGACHVLIVKDGQEWEAVAGKDFEMRDVVAYEEKDNLNGEACAICEKATRTTFWGCELNDEEIGAHRLSYRTIASVFDAVQINFKSLMKVDASIFDNMENETEESEEEGEDPQYKEIYQWFIVSNYGAEILRDMGECLTYSDILDAYIWGVDHWGTSWDYVLTPVKIAEDCGSVVCWNIYGEEKETKEE